MSNEIINDYGVNIYEPPQTCTYSLGAVTIGDLHANAVKFFYFLLRHNIIKFKQGVDPKIAYDKLVGVYEAKFTEKKELKSMLDTFDTCMDSIEVKNNTTLVRLIGDELADRGSNDWFILRILGFLRDAGVVVHINISNHGADFISAYESERFNIQGNLDPRFTMSLSGLKLLLDANLVSIKNVESLVKKAYKPCMKVIDYTLSSTGITLFTHAPVSFNSIQSMANFMRVDYNDASKEELAFTIISINNVFKKEYVDQNKVASLFKITETMNLDDMKDTEINTHPLIYFSWNRLSEKKNNFCLRPKEVNGYNVVYVHGHDDYIPINQPEVVNLDNYCGKLTRKQEEYERVRQPSSVVSVFNQYTVIDSDEFPLAVNS